MGARGGFWPQLCGHIDQGGLVEKVTFEHMFGDGKGGSLGTSGEGHSRQGAARWEEQPGLQLEQSEGPSERAGGEG